MQPRLSFSNLNCFATAAEALSFQRAAEVLHVTPSAVSHQIRNLESVLGYPLFDRLDKRVQLTDGGQRLYLEIRAPLRQLHQASRNALQGGEDDALALSVAPVFATRWLLPRLREFRACHPDIQLSVIATTDLVDFHRDRCDAAIRIGAGHWPGTESKRLFGSRFAAVCHPALVTANGGLFTVAQLSAQALIHNAAMPGLWQSWFESAGVAAADTPTGLEVQNAAQLLEAIDAGDAIGLIDLTLIADEIEGGRLALAADHLLCDEADYYLTYPLSLRQRRSLQAFEDWILMQVDGDRRQAERRASVDEADKVR